MSTPPDSAHSTPAPSQKKKPGRKPKNVPPPASSSTASSTQDRTTQQQQQQQTSESKESHSDVYRSPLNDIPMAHMMRQPSLFGQPLSNLSAPPSLTSANKFAEWKACFVNYATMNNFHYLLKNQHSESWALAQEFNWNNMPDKQLKLIYTQLNERIVAAISSAIMPILPNMQSILDDIKLQTHSSELDRFLPFHDDAHLVWSKVCSMYEHRTMFSVVGTWNQLFSLRYKEGTDPTILWNAFQSLNIKLITALKDDKLLSGQVLTEQCKAAILLNAMPESMTVDHSIMMNKDKIAPIDVINHLARKYESTTKSSSRISTDSDPSAEKAYSLTPLSRHHNRSNARGHGRIQQQSNWKNERRQRSHSPMNSDTDEESMPTGNWKQAFYFEQTQSPSAHIDHTNTAITAKRCPAAARPHPSALHRVILDSGSTCHVWMSNNGVVDERQVPAQHVLSALGESTELSHVGTVQLTPNIRLTDVALVKSAPANLMSVHRVFQSGCRVVMHHDQAQIISRCGRRVLLTFRKENGLYVYYYRRGKTKNNTHHNR